MHVPTSDDNDDAGLTPEQRFGRVVREWRKAQNASQEMIAALLRNAGVPLTQAQVSRIEEGKRPIRLDEAAVLCRVLELDPVDVLTEALSKFDPPRTQTTERAAWVELLNAARALMTETTNLEGARLAVGRQMGATAEAIAVWQKVVEPVEPGKTPHRDIDGVQLLLLRGARLLGREDL